MKKIGLVAVFLLTGTVMGMTSFAGQWQQDAKGWWYQNGDGTYLANTWKWLDGNGDGVSECYYFGADGYAVTNSTTPDGCTVNADGAWTENGIVKTKTGQWIQDARGWRYQNGDDSYLTNTWRWLDGNKDNVAECYYFGADGYAVIDDFTPDGCVVDNKGAWMENGIVMTKYVGQASVSPSGSTTSTGSSSGGSGSSSGAGTSTTSASSGNGASSSDDDDGEVVDFSNNKDVDISEYAKECFDLVNKKRTAAGLKKLTWDDAIAEACDIRAEEISEKFSHLRPNGESWFTVLDEVGADLSGEGENLAEGYSTPQKAVSAWMNSKGHKENILDKSWKKSAIGVHYNSSANKYYWVQLFGK